MPRSGIGTKLPGAALALAGLVSGCAAAAPGPSADERCLLRVWYRPTAALRRDDLKLTPSAALRPELIGSWNDFRRPGLREFDHRQAPDGTQWWTVALALPAGSYEYAIVVGDQLLTDDLNPQSTFRPNPLYGDSGPYEAEFSTFVVPDCTLPQLAVRESLSAPAPPAAPGELAVTWRFTPGSLGAATVVLKLGGGKIDPGRLLYNIDWDGDGKVDDKNVPFSTELHHDYPNPGTYKILVEARDPAWMLIKRSDDFFGAKAPLTAKVD